MAAAPDQTRRESDPDGGWDDDAGDAQPRSGLSPTPVRSGTRDWGDLDDAVDAHRARVRALARVEPPPRGGTRDWEELLPPAVLARYRAIAAAARKKVSAVRGGTRDWDELTRLVNAEIAALRAGAATAEDPLDALAVDELATWLLDEEPAPASGAAVARNSSKASGGSRGAPGAVGGEAARDDAALDDAPSIVVHGEEPWNGDNDDDG